MDIVQSTFQNAEDRQGIAGEVSSVWCSISCSRTGAAVNILISNYS